MISQSELLAEIERDAVTWIDQNGEVRPQSWEEYCEMRESLPAWATPNRAYEPVRPRNRERLPRMRERLFRANPHCFWCGCKVRLNVKHGSPDLATVDHLYSRFHPKRVENHQRQKGVLHVLACHACNHERGLCEQHQRPFIPKLAKRLEFAQLADATLANRAQRAATAKPSAPEYHPAQVLSLKEESIVCLEKVLKRRALCTLKEAVEFTRGNPSR